MPSGSHRVCDISLPGSNTYPTGTYDPRNKRSVQHRNIIATTHHQSRQSTKTSKLIIITMNTPPSGSHRVCDISLPGSNTYHTGTYDPRKKRSVQHQSIMATTHHQSRHSSKTLNLIIIIIIITMNPPLGIPSCLRHFITGFQYRPHRHIRSA